MADTRRKKQSGRRQFLAGTLVGMAGSPLAAGAATPALAQTAERSEARLKGLSPKGVPLADSGYTPGVLAQGRRVVFVSGQGPDDLDADMETQIRQTLENIGGVLEAAGASFRNVAVVRGYFVHLLRDLPIYRKVRKDYFVKPYPASSCVGVTELAIPGLQVELEATAVL
jgi:enamine deaminase RidA (YjgF/YER057c/UK114 family)